MSNSRNFFVFKTEILFQIDTASYIQIQFNTDYFQNKNQGKYAPCATPILKKTVSYNGFGQSIYQ